MVRNPLCSLCSDHEPIFHYCQISHSHFQLIPACLVSMLAEHCFPARLSNYLDMLLVMFGFRLLRLIRQDVGSPDQHTPAYAPHQTGISSKNYFQTMYFHLLILLTLTRKVQQGSWWVRDGFKTRILLFYD